MTFVKLPIAAQTYKNVNEESLTAEGSELQDGYVTEKGALKRRHGLSLFKDLSTSVPIENMFYWQDKDLLFAVSNKTLYKIDEAGTATSLAGSLLTGLERPTFAVVGKYLFVADGGKIFYTDSVTNLAAIADADAPQEVSHLATLDNYLIANNITAGTFQFSSPLDPLDWTATDFATPEAVSDTLLALIATKREILLLGSGSMEFFFNDGASPFSANVNKLIGRGSLAKNTLVLLQDEIPIWMDHNRRFVKFEGGTVQSVSTPYDKEIAALDTVEDAFAFDLRKDGRGFYVITFPTEDRTFVYDYFMQQWYEWGLWNAGAGTFSRYLGNCSAYCTKWNKHYVGSKTDGKILEVKADTYTDNSTIMRFRKRTGHIDHGTSLLKSSKQLLIRVKSGEGETSDATINPDLLIRYKNDNNNRWTNYKPVKLKKVGNTEFIARVHQLGQYRTRQWEFTFAQQLDLEIVSIEEDVEVLPQ